MPCLMMTDKSDQCLGSRQHCCKIIEEATPRWQPVLVILVLWFLVWLATKGNDTLALGGRDKTPVMNSLTGFRDTMLAVITPSR